MRRDARRLRRVSADLLILALAVALALPASALARRAIPDTGAAVHVWDDQLPDSMTDAQIRFVARHVDGTQKVSRQTAERLRAVNSRFLVLHYRLGIGDGPIPFRIGERWAIRLRVRHAARIVVLAPERPARVPATVGLVSNEPGQRLAQLLGAAGLV